MPSSSADRHQKESASTESTTSFGNVAGSKFSGTASTLTSSHEIHQYTPTKTLERTALQDHLCPVHIHTPDAV